MRHFNSYARQIPRLFLLLVACGPAEAPKGTSSVTSAPSVLLISFDTCRADVFGVLTGEQPSLTPRLDEFAEDAVIFEKAFAQTPHTLPSHMSMFTSVYPDAHGVRPNQGPLSKSLVTLPQILQEAGYQTIGLVTTEWLKPDFGFGRGFDHYERLSHQPTYAERVNEAALKRFRGTGEKPLFLFLHYYDLHSDFEHFPARNKFPYYSLPEFRKALPVSADGSEFCDAEGRCNTHYLIGINQDQRPVSRREIEAIHGLYRAAVPQLDGQIGEFFGELKRNGIYDRLLIIVTADHGEEFHEHNRFIHSQPYDETIHIPLFVKFPKSWQAGKRIPNVAETVDILPTLLDFLKLDSLDYSQGESLMPLIKGEPGRQKETVLSQDAVTYSRYGLRTDQMKFIMNLKTSLVELYDLLKDPEERHDLASERPEVAVAFETRLRRSIRISQALQRTEAKGNAPTGPLLSSEEKERLKSLGYLE